MRHELRTLERHVAGLDRAAAASRESLGRGTSTLMEYARVDSNALTAQAEQVQLRSSLAQAQAVLAMLLAQPF
jgi:outer membrane protein TolC